LVCSPVREGDFGANDEIAYGSRHEYLALVGFGHDPGSQMNCDSAHVVSSYLNLAGVDSGSQLDPHLCELVAQVGCATDGAARPVEGRQYTVAGALHYDAFVPFDYLARRFVVDVEEGSP
jgi:hypothetical protein